MDQNQKMAPEEALNEIRELMNRSSRSYMSEWAPLICGIVAVAGGLTAGRLIAGGASVCTINVVAGVTLILGMAFPFLLYAVWAKRHGIPLSFNAVNRRMAGALFVPMVAGGAMCIGLEVVGLYEWTAAAMLLFYGLGVVNMGHYSEKTLPWPGYLFIAVGALACFLHEYALQLWIAGFGGVHLAYGVYLILKNRG